MVTKPNSNSVVQATTFSSNVAAIQSAKALLERLVTSLNDYVLDSTTGLITSPDGIEDITSDLIKIGFKPFHLAIWTVSPELIRGRFLSMFERFPICVYLNANGETSILMLGKSLPKFRQFLEPYERLLASEPTLGISMMTQGINGLRMQFNVNNPKAVVAILRQQGFVENPELLFSKQLGLYATYVGTTLTVMDSHY